MGTQIKAAITPVDALRSEPRLVDAILDRLVHNAYKIQLKGESMRKHKTKLAPTTDPE